MARMTGPRTASQSIIARRAPIRAISLPPGTAPSPTPISSAATTRLMRVADPDVSSTNHGRASQVICDPVVETTSAASSAASERFRSIVLARDGGGANDRDVPAEALDTELGHRALRGVAVADLELRGHVAAPRRGVDPDADARADADADVAGDGLRGHRPVPCAHCDLVARDAVQRDRAVRGADREIAGDRLRGHGALAGLDGDVARDRLELGVATDATDVDVRADGAQPQVAGELGDLDVAGGRLDLGAAETAARIHVGRARLHLEVGAGRAGHAHEHLWRPAEQEAELAGRAALRNLDAELVATGALAQLDAGGL